MILSVSMKADGKETTSRFRTTKLLPFSEKNKKTSPKNGEVLHFYDTEEPKPTFCSMISASDIPSQTLLESFSHQMRMHPSWET